MKRIVLALIASALLLSCGKTGKGGENPNAVKIDFSVVEAVDVDKFSAVLNGAVNITNATTSAKACFYYSETEGSAKNLKSSGTRVYAGDFSKDGGEFSVQLKDLSFGSTYYYVAAVTVDKQEVFGDVQSFTTVKPGKCPAGAVDLGLSVHWATCNLGSSTPEGYGDYYAWGATEPWYEDGYAYSSPTVWKTGREDGYWWPNAPFNGGANAYDSEYWNAHKLECVDANGVLLPENDAAHVILGGRWRMPTEEEIDELLANCDYRPYTLNGVFGLLLTSKRNGENLFLPAADNRTFALMPHNFDCCFYWSSTLVSADPFFGATLAVQLLANLFRGIIESDTTQRCYGNSIRPVVD